MASVCQLMNRLGRISFLFSISLNKTDAYFSLSLLNLNYLNFNRCRKWHYYVIVLTLIYLNCHSCGTQVTQTSFEWQWKLIFKESTCCYYGSLTETYLIIRDICCQKGTYNIPADSLFRSQIHDIQTWLETYFVWYDNHMLKQRSRVSS